MTTAPPKVLIFDATGIVVRPLAEIVQSASQAYGVAPSLIEALLESEEMDAFFRGRSSSFLGDIQERFGFDTGIGSLFDVMRTVGKQDLSRMLLRLRKKYRIALLAEMPAEWFDLANRLNRFDALFDGVFASCYTGVRAPEPEAYLQIARAMGAAPNECVYIGAEQRKVDGAAEVGMRGMAIADLPSLGNVLERLGVEAEEMIPIKNGVLGGVYGVEMTPRAVASIGRALGGIVGEGKTVAIARDDSRYAAALRDAIVGGCVGAGCDVVDFGIAPPSALTIGMAARQIEVGVMMSRPDPISSYVALSFSFKSGDGIGNMGKIAAGAARGGTGTHGSFRVDPIRADYAAYLASRATDPIGIGALDRPVRVALLSPYTDLATFIFRGAGLEIVEKDYDMGVSISGNGATVRFFDERGEPLDGYAALALLASPSIAAGGKIACDYGCPEAVMAELTERGGKVVFGDLASYNGRDTERSQLHAIGASVGYDGEGGYYFDETLGAPDGIFAALLLARRVAESGSRMSEMAKGFPRSYAVEKVVECEEAVKGSIFNALASAPDSARDGNSIRIDAGETAVFVATKSFPDALRIRAVGAAEGQVAQAMGALLLRVSDALKTQTNEIPGVVWRMQGIPRASKIQ